MILKISDIIIKSDRIRTELGDIDQLAESIRRFGLMHPPVVSKEVEGYVLIAGERRIRALQKLNIQETPVNVLGSIAPQDQAIMELEENIQRLDLPWTEKVEAIHKLYSLESTNTDKTLEKVASMLNMSVSSISKSIQLAQAVKEIPEIASASNEHKARKLMAALESAAITTEIIKRHKGKSTVNLTELFLNGNCTELIKHLPTDSVDIILTDPPFGIGIESISKYGLGTYGKIYKEEDTVEWLFGMLDILVAEFKRVLKKDSIVFIFFGIQHYQKLCELFLKHEFYIDDIPAIWAKNQSGQSQRPELWLGSCYEPFLVARKGKKVFLKQGRGNIFNFSKLPPAEKVHPFEKPIELLKDILSLTSLPGDIVLDPFAGTANSLIAARQLQCGFIGYEIDEDYWSEGQFRLNVLGKGAE